MNTESSSENKIEPGIESGAGVEAKAETESRNAPVAKGGSSAAPWIASFAVLLAVGAGGASFLMSQQVNETNIKISTLTTELGQIKQQTSDKLQQAASDRNSLQTTLQTELKGVLSNSEQQQVRVKQLNEEVKHLSDSTTAISDRLGRNSTTWLIAEAEYLMMVANHRVTLDQDAVTAVAALLAADQRIKQVGDPGLLEVRRKITEEINALRSVEIPDISGMALELAALTTAAEQLPLIIKQRGQQFDSTFSSTEEASAKPDDVSGVMNAVWKDLKSLVVIRKNDKPIDALMAPDQRYFLFQNLILKLETGRLALLRGEQANLKASLDVSQQWLQAYFDKETTAVKNFDSTLARIKTASLTATMPDISGSVKMLRKFNERKADSTVSQAPKKKQKKKKIVAKIKPKPVAAPTPPAQVISKKEPTKAEPEKKTEEVTETKVVETNVPQPVLTLEDSQPVSKQVVATEGAEVELETKEPELVAEQQSAEATIDATINAAQESTP